MVRFGSPGSDVFSTLRRKDARMYEVVGCPSCHALWILEKDEEAASAQCPRCRTRHDRDRLRTLATADSPASARDARTRLLAARSVDDPDDVADFSSLEADTEEAVISDEEYLTANGIALDEDDDASPSGDRRQTIRDAIASAEPPTEEEIVAITATHGIDRETTLATLERLVSSGHAIEERGEYRLL